MANILKIYEDYKIMPQLQLHQLRVAAVAWQICDSLTVGVDKPSIIAACLLHDMGNIIKFDLEVTIKVSNGLVKPEDLAYWQQVQQQYIQKYGHNEHAATLAIAKELGVSDKVYECIEAVGFNFALENARSPELEGKICDNADMRVSPNGIVNIQQRLEDGSKRYKSRPDKWVPLSELTEQIEACYKIERQIYAYSRIKPQDITDQTTEPLVEQLKSYEI